MAWQYLYFWPTRSVTGLLISLAQMTQAQAVRIQRGILRGSDCEPNGEPFLDYGIWVLPFTRNGVGLEVFLIDRPIASEADHQVAKIEAAEKLGQAIARPV
jgi:hypothetical protein